MEYNIEYDFVGSDGVETKQLTIFDPTVEIKGGQNVLENPDVDKQEVESGFFTTLSPPVAALSCSTWSRSCS